MYEAYPIYSSRSSSSYRLTSMVNDILRLNNEIMERQRQISTGARLTSISTDPVSTSLTIGLQSLLEEKQQYYDNIQQGSSILSMIDQSLGDLSNLIMDVKSNVLQSIGDITSDDERQAIAQTITEYLNQVVAIGNKQYNGKYFFAGSNSPQQPFEFIDGYVRFNGTDDQLAINADIGLAMPINIKSSEPFGALLAAVQGTSDLNPAITVDTLLADINGGDGVQTGSIIISDGTSSYTVDFSQAKTIGDVIDAINAATPASITASINTAQNGLQIVSSNPGDDITVVNTGGNQTAQTLGIYQPTSGAVGATLTGVDVTPQLNLLTPTSALNGGSGIDLTSGLIIANGTFQATVDLSSAATLQDIVNAINQSGTQVFARINASGTGIDVVSRLSGADLTIGENGGTTASDLGIRSLNADTRLDSLNNGRGITTVDGDDFIITQRDGTTISVDVSSAHSIQDVLDLINNDSENTGDLIARLAGTGNGIELVDSSTDAGFDLKVETLNSSTAAEGLGILGSVPNPADMLTGSDINPITNGGIIDNLIRLVGALQTNDQVALQILGPKFDDNLQQVVTTRASVGTRMNSLELMQNRLDAEILDVQKMLSEEYDVDYNQALAEYQSYQTILQASLKTSSALMGLNLFDFL